MSESLCAEHQLAPDLKAKWLEALRSDRYDQGVGQLCERNTRGDFEWCCLGVLAHVAGINNARFINADTLSKIARDDLLGPWAQIAGDVHEYYEANKPETHTTLQRKLAAMNDNGKSFAEIADWIEANL